MASEDSRNRDGSRKFIVSAFAVLNGCSSKNGMMRCCRSTRDLTASEELHEIVQDVRTRRRLDDCELRLDLPAESRARLPEHRHREAALAVDEADDPLLEPWSFLLIDRTGHIVTSTADPRSGVRRFR